MRQMRHIADTKMRFQLLRVSHPYPSQIRFLPMLWYTLRPKRDTKSHPIHRLHARPSGLDTIKYRQFTTDIALEVSERCKTLTLEHHKCHKMRTSKARNAGCHAKTSGIAARDLSIGSISLPRTRSEGKGDSRRFNHLTCNNRKTLPNDTLGLTNSTPRAYLGRQSRR